MIQFSLMKDQLNKEKTPKRAKNMQGILLDLPRSGILKSYCEIWWSDYLILLLWVWFEKIRFMAL